MTRFLKLILPPLAMACFVGALWQACVWAFDIPPYLLPSPLRVGQAFGVHAAELLRATRYTAIAAVCGLAASATIGTLIAILFSQSSMLRRSSYPYAIYLQTAPIVAIAPLLATWIGEGFFAIVIVVFIISLFPVITNGTDGLLSTPTELRELFALYQANRWQTLWKLQVPHALPRLLTGLKTSSAMVVLGATVGEYFVGSQGSQDFGLGHVIFKSIPLLQIDKLFATTLLCTLLSVCLFSAISFLSRVCLRWQSSP